MVGIPARRATAAKPVRPRTLNQATIVEAALQIIEQEGVDALTARSLAKRLDVSHAAMYRHFEDKQALLETIADALYATVPIPERDPQEWDACLRELARSLIAMRARYPWAPVIVQQREFREHVESPNVLRLSNYVRSLFVAAGFDPAAVELAGLAWAGLMSGMELQSRLRSRHGAGESAADTGAFEFGIDVFVSGLLAKVSPAVR